MNGLLLKIKRGETPVFRATKRILKAILRPSPPRLPAFIKPLFRFVYEAYWWSVICWRGFFGFFVLQPLFQSRCATFGKGVSIDLLPFVSGHVELHIGNHCWIGGKVSIFSSRIVDQPRFVMKDHAEIGWNVTVVANEEVILEEHSRVSNDCRISDSDGHPRQADLRAQGLPMHRKDIKPVRIGKHAWIGNGTHIMKGVTIGEGAIVGANSVVITDIPPYCLALGNPAEVFFRNYGKPSRQPQKKDEDPAGESTGPTPQSS
jgi:acetyltransferase-like isoleucine patch superfamily enzyme